METAVPTIRIAKPGSFTSVEGVKVNWTIADLEAAAASYDPESDPAPMVIGHPSLEAPAYGWARELRVEDGHLVAIPDPEKTVPGFAEAVRDGRYRKVSPRFYQPTSPGNPKPGSLYLQHIGFLGAAAPAIKGLGTVSTVSFADTDADLVTVDQPAPEPTQETAMDDTQNVSFAEREAELDTRSGALDTREAAVAEREANAFRIQHDSNVSFAEGLVTAGKLAPVAKPMLIGLLDQLGGAKPDTISFGEGNGELAPDAVLRKLFDGAQPLVSFAEAAKPEDKDDTKGGTVSFAAPPGYEVDPQRAEIDAKARELQAQDPNLSYIDAVKRAGG